MSRPTATQLLHHKFITRNAKDKAFLIKALRIGEPSGERVEVQGAVKTLGSIGGCTVVP